MSAKPDVRRARFWTELLHVRRQHCQRFLVGTNRIFFTMFVVKDFECFDLLARI
ncbi:hypothetical protein SynA15127_00947 [Synechococcus sp. A15-127]|nr:hypothetical protein SynA15127_00947 [Synechococcus sp. A15-127]